ncbi:Hypothetical predicted protein, partial [Pelobates cultripes]
PGDQVLVKTFFKSGTFDPPYRPLTTVVAITRRAVLTEENQIWNHASRLKRCHIKHSGYSKQRTFNLRLIQNEQ